MRATRTLEGQLGNQRTDEIGTLLLLRVIEIKVEVCHGEGRIQLAMAMDILNNG
jgi:hypothetical protein